MILTLFNEQEIIIKNTVIMKDYLVLKMLMIPKTIVKQINKL